MNFHLADTKVMIGGEEVPHMSSCSSMFVRGNVIRYVHLSKSQVDIEPLTEACRKEAVRANQKQQQK